MNQQGYEHAAKMSLGNTRLMALLAEQFRVPPADALATAEKVLDARLLDPLGGKYELVVGPGGAGTWRSSQSAAGAPAGYQFPALTWIRGLDMEGRLSEGQVVLHAELEMPLEITTPGKPGAAVPAPAAPNGAQSKAVQSKPMTPKPAQPTPAPPQPGPISGLLRGLIPPPPAPQPGAVPPARSGAREF